MTGKSDEEERGVVTDAEDVEAEALAGGLVDQLVWEADKAHMA